MLSFLNTTRKQDLVYPTRSLHLVSFKTGFGEKGEDNHRMCEKSRAEDRLRVGF